MRYQKCHWNVNLRCHDHTVCPFEDKTWVNILERWALTAREPAAINWERGGEPNPKSEERKTLQKVEVSRLFYAPEVVEAVIKFGGMTSVICEDLQRGRFLWKETNLGISLKRAKERWISVLKKKLDKHKSNVR